MPLNVFGQNGASINLAAARHPDLVGQRPEAEGKGRPTAAEGSLVTETQANHIEQLRNLLKPLSELLQLLLGGKALYADAVNPSMSIHGDGEETAQSVFGPHPGGPSGHCC